MVSAGVMTLDLGWQGMQSKFWMGVFLFLGGALVALAQNDDLISESEAKTEDNSTSIMEASSPETNGKADKQNNIVSNTDEYEPSERTSEDRSVSFPVDI